MSPVPANNREPNNKDEEDVKATDAPQIDIEESGSDSEGEVEADGDEEAGYQGYQLLPQDPDNNAAENIEDSLPQVTAIMDTAIMQALDSQDMMFAAAPQDLEEEPIPSETVELWNSDSNRAPHKPMDPDHAEKIKTAMAGFVLPPSAQPDWASQLSDEEWKQAIMKKGSLSGSGSYKQGQPSRSADEKNKDKVLER